MGQARGSRRTHFNESEAFGESRWQADEGNNGIEAPESEAEGSQIARNRSPVAAGFAKKPEECAPKPSSGWCAICVGQLHLVH